MTKQREATKTGKAKPSVQPLDDSHLRSQIVGLKRKAAARKAAARDIRGSRGAQGVSPDSESTAKDARGLQLFLTADRTVQG